VYYNDDIVDIKEDYNSSISKKAFALQNLDKSKLFYSEFKLIIPQKGRAWYSIQCSKEFKTLSLPKLSARVYYIQQFVYKGVVKGVHYV
jgi:hypothetical protein